MLVTNQTTHNRALCAIPSHERKLTKPHFIPTESYFRLCSVLSNGLLCEGDHSSSNCAATDDVDGDC